MNPYVPPPLDSDEPLDPVEQALVRMFVEWLVEDIQQEQVEEIAPNRPKDE